MNICYGNRIRLQHQASGVMLHSHPLNYSHSGTSGQQQVTGFTGRDANDFWIVKGDDGDPQNFHEGQAVQNGNILRLEHLQTRKNLHSHDNCPSPASGQREVTGYGQFGFGDNNDRWRVEVDGGGTWNTSKRVRLIHVETNNALHSHASFPHVGSIQNQQEVTCFTHRDDNDWWLAIDEGWLGFPLPNTCGGGVRNFTVSQWALHFENNFGNMPLRRINVAGINVDVQASNAGRCGGMALAVRDYYEAGLLLPVMTTVPPTNSALFNHIADRLLDSFDVPNGGPAKWKLLTDPAMPDEDKTIGGSDPTGVAGALGGIWHNVTGGSDPSHETLVRGRAWIMIREEWPAIRHELDAGKLCPIGLVLTVSADPQQLGNNHTVLAYGYDLRGNDLIIHIYDPNCPCKYDVTWPVDENRTWRDGDNQSIRLDIGDPGKHTDVWSSNGYNIRCFFRLNYTRKTPPVQLAHDKKVRFRSINGNYLATDGVSGVVKARGVNTSTAAVFTIKKVRDPQLISGDSINLTASNGKYLAAEHGGGDVVIANRDSANIWEQYLIKRVRGEGEILNGQQVALRAFNGQYLCAEGGGGADVNANRDVIGVWETFMIEFV